MSEVAASTSAPVRPAAAEEAAGGNTTEEEDGAPNPREVQCSDCIVWNRQQTWLCVVPLLIGFIGLGLSLMLLKWIVVGSVKDYVPTDLMDSKGIGQDPIFLSKPSSFPKSMETTTTTTTTRTPNQISTRLTTTTRAPTRIPGSRVPIRANPRTTTVRHTVAPPTIISTTVPLSTTTFVSRPLPGTPTTQPMPIWPTAEYSTSSYKIYLHVSTQSWTQSHFQESTTSTPETTTMSKHQTTTYFTERSEHFKPCKDKDLAYCLNDGECFVIETLTASHKHCRCKEGYQGVRCDQFLPKTDSVLSDPTDHLGIEFMESEEVYQQQILSISCIIFAIVAVGLICAAFYCRTKRQTKIIKEQLKEMHNWKHYSLNASSLLSKAKSFGENRVQLHTYSKSERNTEPIRENVMETSFAETQPFSETTPSDRASQAVKHHRCSTMDLNHPQNNSINMQLHSKEPQSYFNNKDQKDCIRFSMSRASSIPIIPSVGLDDACMQMQNVSETSGIKLCKNFYSSELMKVNITSNNCLIGEQKEVKILLETVQEQIRILTNARGMSSFQEDLEMANVQSKESTSENTAFLLLSPKAKTEPETRFVLSNEIHRDSKLHV
ncbi:pro-neuregulin-3, membrane-bound isoform isoform X3 [Mixophyes fleayi]|uniref:pro-neuregulin-3, membrane-bound isoform isoform X3 n=1 Tax=Mixophyes fleayi TaxID=3061075 RepID=UPI003F4DDAAA